MEGLALKDILYQKEQIRNILKNINAVSNSTFKDDKNMSKIEFWENPLDPNLLLYCFNNILGFNVRCRIAEKVNYVIEFDYKGTWATAQHFKLSYCILIRSCYKQEILDILGHVKPVLEHLFMLIGEQSLNCNDFSMKNEAPDYFKKLEFYQERIEKLQKREHVVHKKLSGQYEIIDCGNGCKGIRHKGSEYMRYLRNEIIYDIEAYIDTFFSALEHVLTLLYPFTVPLKTKDSKSYYKYYIRNTRWDWSSKIQDTFQNQGSDDLLDLLEKLRKIKEVYRNHNAHGGFSREMMVYVQIPNFGRFPIYVGKNYLKGFIQCDSNTVSYNMYLDAKAIFEEFWNKLDTSFDIAMVFIRSGLPIPVDTSIYTAGVENVEQAETCVDQIWYDICNQSNMDW